MNIEGITQAMGRHGGALNVPARTPIPPWRGPTNLAFACGFPKRKISRASLGFLHINARTCQQVFELFLAEFSVVLKRLYGKINITVSCSIGMIGFNQRTDHGNDLSNIIRSPWLFAG